MKKTELTSKKIAKLIAELAFDKKAEDIVILDMRKVVNFCDYFVICTASSDRRIRAVADGIDEGLSKVGVKVRLSQGVSDSKWTLMDTGDVVTHIFVPETREFYALDHLWQDAPRVALKK